MEKTYVCLEKPYALSIVKPSYMDNMILVSDLQQLISTWQERANNSSQPFDYKNGVGECIFDLSHLITHSIDEELDYQDFLEQEADSYLSSMDAHESVA